MEILFFVMEFSLKTSVVWLMLAQLVHEPTNLIARSVKLKEMWIVSCVFSLVWSVY